MRRIIKMLAALVSVGLLGTLGTGGGFIRGNQESDAQTFERPNFVVIMTDDLNNQSMARLPGIETLMGSKEVPSRTRTSPMLCVVRVGPATCGASTHNHGITDCEGNLETEVPASRTGQVPWRPGSMRQATRLSTWGST